MIFVEQAQRRIPVQYARRMVGRKMFGGARPHPPQVNQAGVIPVIFASLLYPAGNGVVQQPPNNKWATWINDYLVRGDHPLYMLAFFGLIVFFTHFYGSITFNPEEVADNMKKYGGFIPGSGRASRPRTTSPTSCPASPCPVPCTSGSSLSSRSSSRSPWRCQPELPVRGHRSRSWSASPWTHREADRVTSQRCNGRFLPKGSELVR